MKQSYERSILVKLISGYVFLAGGTLFLVAFALDLQFEPENSKLYLCVVYIAVVTLLAAMVGVIYAGFLQFSTLPFCAHCCCCSAKVRRAMAMRIDSKVIPQHWIRARWICMGLSFVAFPMIVVSAYYYWYHGLLIATLFEDVILAVQFYAKYVIDSAVLPLVGRQQEPALSAEALLTVLEPSKTEQ